MDIKFLEISICVSLHRFTRFMYGFVWKLLVVRTRYPKNEIPKNYAKDQGSEGQHTAHCAQ